MDARTKAAIIEWLAKDGGDVEALARWMSRSLRIGGLKDCRALINEALAQ